MHRYKFADWHLKFDIYPAAIVLVPLHHHLKFFVDLRVFGLGARGKIVFDCIRFRALRRHGTLMLLLVERLQVSADRFTWPHRPRALNLHMHINLTPSTRVCARALLTLYPVYPTQLCSCMKEGKRNEIASRSPIKTRLYSTNVIRARY